LSEDIDDFEVSRGLRPPYNPKELKKKKEEMQAVLQFTPSKSPSERGGEHALTFFSLFI
jgi:hypothetical protein